MIKATSQVTEKYQSDCKMTKLGFEYKGNVSVTQSGIVCQRWDSNTPHRPQGEAFSTRAVERDKYKDNYPEESIYKAENYCRNPDAEPEGPWCYSVNPKKRWEYCDIPLCSLKQAQSPHSGSQGG